MTWQKNLKRSRAMATRHHERHGGHHRWLIRAALFIVTASVLGVVLAKTHRSLSDAPPTSALPPSDTVTITLPVPQADQDEFIGPPPLGSAPEIDPWEYVTVKKGDTLSTIFSRLEIHSQLHKIVSLPEIKAQLKSIKPRDRIQILKDNGKLAELIYHKSQTERIHVKRDGDRYVAERISDPIESRQAVAEATISDSLFMAGKKAGISDNLIMELAEIFEYDIDFALDIRSGDQFRVIYLEQFANGKKLKDGPILGAQFINQGKTYYAFRYTNPKGETGYYSADGRSLKKAFIRTPVKFSRISSHFNPKRKHPILHTVRAHRGVDYAAPKGTPVKATGNGKVIFAGWKKGYGKTIIVKHGNRYSTLYAHLNGFHKGIKRGRRVKQGQVIAYVGMTGSATGYHLHYEFRVNGVHKNPVTVKLPKAPPLPKSLKSDFLNKTASLKSQLEHYASLASAH